MFKKKKDQEKKKNSKDNKTKKEQSTEIGYFLEKSPYYFSPSFISHNGLHASIVNLYVRVGTNRRMTFTDVLDFIPVNTLDGIEMHFLTYDQLIKDDPKTKLIKDNASSGIQMNDEDAKDRKKAEDDDAAKEEMRKAENEDYVDYQKMMEEPEPVAVFKIKLLLIGDSREIIDEQIEILNLSLNTRHSGAEWDSIGGDQSDQYQNLFGRVELDQSSMTSTGYNYAGLNFAVSQGVFDDNGVPIGQDALSLSSSTSIFDFDSYLQKQAIVAIPRASTMKTYRREDQTLQISSSSIVMQAAANQMLMNGKRSHHIVLNDFDYREPAMFYRPKESNDLFKHYDVSKVTINPLEGFGEVEDVVNIFSRLTKKIVNIFSLLLDLDLSKGDKAAILSAISEFYVERTYWNSNADKYPKRTQIVNIKNPKTYATMGDFLNTFTTLMKKTLKDGLEMQADRINTLESTLKQALNLYTSVLGRPTAIERSYAPQIYYDYNRIESVKMKQVQFLNTLEYILYTAESGETIFIHGMNELYEETVKMSKESIISAQNRGVRFVFGFDTISSTKSKTGKEIENMCDMFTLKGVLYNNLSKEVDWSMTGKCLPDEVVKFAEASVMTLGTTVENRMQVQAGCQVLLHRSMTQTNNFVHLGVKI